MKGAIAISTYFSKPNLKRLEIFKKSITSLLSSNYTEDIFIVDDGSLNKDHLNWVTTLNYSKIHIHEKSCNGGISRVKNTCIKLILNNGYDFCILADDDIEYHSNWYTEYTNVLEQTNCHHIIFSCYPEKNSHLYQHETINNIEVVNTKTINGCFLLISKELVEKIGYFKVMPGKYGWEHVNYSHRAINSNMTPFCIDIIDSHKYLTLIEDSIHNSSLCIDEDIINGSKKNAELYYLHLNDYCPFED